MINFIICDDEEIFRDSIKEKIDSCMMKSTAEYKTYFFSCYDEKFFNFAKNPNGFNVYFLDIQMPEIDGIDVARYVRYKLGDWSSLIIFVTNFSKYRNKILTSRLDVLDYIKKSKRGYEQLEEVITIVLSKYRSTDSCLTFEKDYSVFKIKYMDIIFIERELNSKCCILYTTSGEYRITKSLTEIEELLDNRFLRTHRSAIINVDKIIEYNVKTNTVIFSTGESTDLVANKENINLSISVAKLDNNAYKFTKDQEKSLSNLIGIFFDNAIDAAKESIKKEILFEVYESNLGVTFLIQNSFTGSLDINKIDKKGFTTKGSGHGNGLYFAQKIVNKNIGIYTRKVVENDFFIQKIIVEKE